MIKTEDKVVNMLYLIMKNDKDGGQSSEYVIFLITVL